MWMHRHHHLHNYNDIKQSPTYLGTSQMSITPCTLLPTYLSRSVGKMVENSEVQDNIQSRPQPPSPRLPPTRKSF
ncbi:hypothetical protein BDW42DRAFT_167746 [Aspergillus taichungensis]|uniref:Uncharacterized protein n=1 Tax=Aspergillus taichungensis TaxID=482145 RepID=A0A2J5HWZ1_9EURO|nr:hypothetical protein BDW42DRAFT_167746 [Aspergillus taichungensis]